MAELELVGPRLVLRTRRTADVDELAALFSEPAVVRWWGSEFEPEGTDDEDVVELTVVLDGEIIGLIQFYEETEPRYRHGGIDLALAERTQGQGLGPEAIRLVVDHLAAIGHHRIIIDPNAANRNAIRAYAKVGFKPVGVMRNYEWDETENRWTDGLLMDLLIDELES